MSETEPNDDELHQALGTLRYARERQAGAFHEVVATGRARARARSRNRRRVALGVVAALPVIAAVAVQLRQEVRERADLTLAREAAHIAEWRSPTDALLDGAYGDLMREIPSLHSSVLDARIQPGGSR